VARRLKPDLDRRAIKAYVVGNNFLYYQKARQRGKPPKFYGPDFYVVLGQEETDQLSYVVWEENNRYPDLIVERADRECVRADQERSRAEDERARAEAERARRERLEQKLRDLGFDPNDP
jgi:hypothetical protein